MSIISIFTQKSPSINAGGDPIVFDAVLEDTIQTQVDYTQFPIEIGADASDHGIIRPIKYTLTGSVSNNPISPSLTDFAGGVVSNFFGSGVASTVAGLSAGFLSGSSETRAGATLELLIGLQYSRVPFDVDAVDYQLTNMVITSITRTRNPENENGLEFVAEMQELPLLATVLLQNQPGQGQLNAGDPSQTMVAADVNKGEVLGSAPSGKITSQVEAIL